MYKIQDFSKDHFFQVRDIIHSNFSNPWSDNNILYNSENSIKKVAVDIKDSTVLGYIDGCIFKDEADLLLLAVRKDFQGLGIGKKLLSCFIDIVKKSSAECIYLEVSCKNNVAVKLYKSFGFKVYGKRSNYYGNGDDAILMKLEINNE